jgi:hypothetical protein
MDKIRLKKLAGLITESKKPLNEFWIENDSTIIVKGKPSKEPDQYVIRCHTKPNQSMVDAGMAKNVRPGSFVIYDSDTGSINGTDDINKATVFSTLKGRKSSDFPWGKDDREKSLKYFKKFFDVDGLTGDFYEPVPAKVKRIIEI